MAESAVQAANGALAEYFRREKELEEMSSDMWEARYKGILRDAIVRVAQELLKTIEPGGDVYLYTPEPGVNDAYLTSQGKVVFRYHPPLKPKEETIEEFAYHMSADPHIARNTLNTLSRVLHKHKS